MNITVYLGAKEGNDPALKRAVQELGQWIGQSGNAFGLFFALSFSLWQYRIILSADTVSEVRQMLSQKRR